MCNISISPQLCPPCPNDVQIDSISGKPYFIYIHKCDHPLQRLWKARRRGQCGLFHQVASQLPRDPWNSFLLCSSSLFPVQLPTTSSVSQGLPPLLGAGHWLQHFDAVESLLAHSGGPSYDTLNIFLSWTAPFPRRVVRKGGSGGDTAPVL